MGERRLSGVLQRLRGLARAEAADAELLRRFVARRDEVAFEELVRRHWPMVWGVCRRVLRESHDAEDAFQATFLVLVRKAATVARPELLGGWLYGVADRTAREARAAAARRRVKEREAGAMPRDDAPEPGPWREALPLLDRELSRLPDKYRIAIVLCDLQGAGRKEAAILGFEAAARSVAAAFSPRRPYSAAGPGRLFDPLVLHFTKPCSRRLSPSRRGRDTIRKRSPP